MKVDKEGEWGYGWVGWRVCNKISVCRPKLDHKGEINNFGHWFGPAINEYQIDKHRI